MEQESERWLHHPPPSLATTAIVANLLTSLWVFLSLCEKDGRLFLFVFHLLFEYAKNENVQC
jgi:hypothetical protein